MKTEAEMKIHLSSSKSDKKKNYKIVNNSSLHAIFFGFIQFQKIVFEIILFMFVLQWIMKLKYF